MAIEHSTITDPELHEPKGVAIALDGDVYVANGLGSGVWRQLPESTGSMVITNNATPQALVAAVDVTLASFSDYVKLVGFTTGELDNLTFANNELTVPVGAGGLYLVDTYLNVSSDVVNTAVAIKFTINGVSGVARRPRHILASAGNFYNLSGSGAVRLADSDVVAMYIVSSKTANILVQDSSFLMHKVGE